MSMTPLDPAAPVPEMIHELDLHPEEGSEDEPLRLLASFWRRPEGDTWRLEAFTIREDGDGPYYEPRPDLTMNLPAATLEDATEDRQADAERYQARAAEPLRLARLALDQADLINALAAELERSGAPPASPPIVAPAPTPPPTRPDAAPRIRSPRGAVTNPGISREAAEAIERRRIAREEADAATAAGTRVKPQRTIPARIEETTSDVQATPNP